MRSTITIAKRGYIERRGVGGLEKKVIPCSKAEIFLKLFTGPLICGAEFHLLRLIKNLVMKVLNNLTVTFDDYFVDRVAYGQVAEMLPFMKFI